MLPGEVAPATIIRGEPIVWGAEISGGDDNGGAARAAPADMVNTPDLKAGSTGTPFVEQHSA